MALFIWCAQYVGPRTVKEWVQFLASTVLAVYLMFLAVTNLHQCPGIPVLPWLCIAMTATSILNAIFDIVFLASRPMEKLAEKSADLPKKWQYRSFPGKMVPVILAGVVFGHTFPNRSKENEAFCNPLLFRFANGTSTGILLIWALIFLAIIAAVVWSKPKAAGTATPASETA